MWAWLIWRRKNFVDLIELFWGALMKCRSGCRMNFRIVEILFSQFDEGRDRSVWFLKLVCEWNRYAIFSLWIWFLKCKHTRPLYHYFLRYSNKKMSYYTYNRTKLYQKSSNFNCIPWACTGNSKYFHAAQLPADIFMYRQRKFGNVKCILHLKKQ